MLSSPGRRQCPHADDQKYDAARYRLGRPDERRGAVPETTTPGPGLQRGIAMCDVNQTDGAKSLCSGAVPPSTRHVHIPSGKYWPGMRPPHICAARRPSQQLPERLSAPVPSSRPSVPRPPRPYYLRLSPKNLADTPSASQEAPQLPTDCLHRTYLPHELPDNPPGAVARADR
jgi:hypothetical protein